MLSFAGQTGKVKTLTLPEPVQTELVEVPVIIVGSEVKLNSPDLKKLKPETLAAMAAAMDGRVGYLKVRAHYEILTTQHCTIHDCWRPAEPGSDRCDTPSHSLRGPK